MGSTSLKPFQISLSALKKCTVVQLVAAVEPLLKITANLKSQMIKNTVPKTLTLLTELFTMCPTAAKKDFRFPFRLLFRYQKSFTTQLALYREAKKHYLSLTFHQVETWLQSKDTYTLDKPVHYNFPRNRVIVTRIDNQWQADLVDISSLARFNKGYKF